MNTYYGTQDIAQVRTLYDTTCYNEDTFLPCMHRYIPD